MGFTVGETFEICLVENSMSGYQWKLLHDGAPVCVTAQPGGTIVNHESTANCGKLQERCWEFRIVQKGEAQIRLSYQRAWETKEPAKTFIMQVQANLAEPK